MLREELRIKDAHVAKIDPGTAPTTPLFMKGCPASRPSTTFFFFSFPAVFDERRLRKAHKALGNGGRSPRHRCFFVVFLVLAPEEGSVRLIYSFVNHCRSASVAGGHTISSGAGGAFTERFQAQRQGP